MIAQSKDVTKFNVFTSSRCRDLVKQQIHYTIALSKKECIYYFGTIFAKENAYMESVSIASVQLTDVQIFYKENRIVISFKSNAQSNPAFREHLRPLYTQFAAQAPVSVTIGGHTFASRILSLASAAPPEQFSSSDPVERLLCGDEFTVTVENGGSIPPDAAEQQTSAAGSSPLCTWR